MSLQVAGVRMGWWRNNLLRVDSVPRGWLMYAGLLGSRWVDSVQLVNARDVI